MAAGVNNFFAWTRAFVALMALHRAEDHVIILRPFSLDWIISFCCVCFKQMYTLVSRWWSLEVLTNPKDWQ